MRKKYKNLDHISISLITFGKIVKLSSIIISGIGIFYSITKIFGGSGFERQTSIPILLASVFFLGIFYSLGIIITAFGELIVAIIDIAVNSWAKSQIVNDDTILADNTIGNNDNSIETYELAGQLFCKKCKLLVISGRQHMCNDGRSA